MTKLGRNMLCDLIIDNARYEQYTEKYKIYITSA
jgi:hypothetical protein